MKTNKLIVSFLFTMIIISLSAQYPVLYKTTTFKVDGDYCGFCKKRIEEAAMIEGVRKAEWNMDSKILTLVYDPKIVKIDDVQKSIMSVGHDTEKYKAPDSIYYELPETCRYRIEI